MKRMTTDEIKKMMSERRINITTLAEKLGVTADGLGRVLSGKRPLTEQLARHIAYVLGQRECIFVYRVTTGDNKVEELTAGRGCVSEADKRAAIKAIIEHNMEQLKQVGAALSWTDEQRRAWGLEPVAASDEVMPGPSEMPVPYVPAARGVQGPSC